MSTANEFTARLADLLRREHAALAEFLVALSEFDARRVWLELGHPNLFSFLHRELRLSKGAAHYRKVAAELVRKFPELVEPLRDGRLCITSVVELAKVLTPENRDEVLPRFFRRSKREAAEVVAALRPLRGSAATDARDAGEQVAGGVPGRRDGGRRPGRRGRWPGARASAHACPGRERVSTGSTGRTPRCQLRRCQPLFVVAAP